MRRFLFVMAGVGALSAVSVLPAHAGSQFAVYAEAHVAGAPVGEPILGQKYGVFSDCGGVTGPPVCETFMGLPPQDAEVFVGDSNVLVSAKGEQADSPGD